MIPVSSPLSQDPGAALLQKNAADRAKNKKADPKNPQLEQLKNIARSFDSLFMSMLMKSMRSTVHKSGFMNGGYGETVFTEMLDQKIADSSSRRGKGLGVADMIVKKYAKQVEEYAGATGAKMDVKQ